jgi:hypothetical protein
MPTYIVPGQWTSGADVKLDLWFLLTLGATDLDERYKILNVDLSEDDVILRLEMSSSTYIHKSVPNWGLTPDSNDSLVNSYITCRGDSESGEPQILFELVHP